MPGATAMIRITSAIDRFLTAPLGDMGSVPWMKLIAVMFAAGYAVVLVFGLARG
jgi:hypothetical protein